MDWLVDELRDGKTEEWMNKKVRMDGYWYI